MIVYSATKKDFTQDVLTNQIANKIQTSFVRETGHNTSKSEVKSWQNSMIYMNNILLDPEIPETAGVAIEYLLPQTSKRVDFILTGYDANNAKTAILVELKQWSEGVAITDKDAVLNTNFYGDVSHPSYQAWTYATLLQDYNSNVQDQKIELAPCAYLHNYPTDNIITNEFYKAHTDKAPVFLRDDTQKLKDFIKHFVKHGDKGQILYAIENGKIRPSKSLSDSLSSMLKNNKEFVLIDEQKVVYETALKLTKESAMANKNVLIVKGGPGTGKSVVAINLLVETTNKGFVAQYVTRNSAPRQVYEAKLAGTITKSRISNMFVSSDVYHAIGANAVDALIVDEGHRLTEKSGMFSNKGENQIKEIINAAKFSIFFLDEDQRVTLKDIGTIDEIKFWATRHNAKITTLELASQFRCSGSNGYISWLDNILQIRETANFDMQDIAYDIEVMSSPQDVYNVILQKNKISNKSRMLAGYCWKWISKESPNLKDIVIGDYKATWNLSEHGQAWIIHPNSVSEVGCIHTCQGLELDYAGVIIGPDLVVRQGKIITDASKRANTDKSVSGYKKMLSQDPAKAKQIADMIIKNTYRTLLTRGMKGCYIYCTDPETQEYFKKHIEVSGSKKYTNIPTGVSINTDLN